MKIDNSVQSLPPGRSNAPPKGADSAAAKAGPSVAQAATPSNIVQIGEAVATRMTETAPSYQTERVAEIKKAIAEGRFKVDAEKIADGLLTSVRDMLNRNNRPA